MEEEKQQKMKEEMQTQAEEQALPEGGLAEARDTEESRKEVPEEEDEEELLKPRLTKAKQRQPQVLLWLCLS